MFSGVSTNRLANTRAMNAAPSSLTTRAWEIPSDSHGRRCPAHRLRGPYVPGRVITTSHLNSSADDDGSQRTSSRPGLLNCTLELDRYVWTGALRVPHARVRPGPAQYQGAIILYVR